MDLWCQGVVTILMSAHCYRSCLECWCGNNTDVRTLLQELFRVLMDLWCQGVVTILMSARCYRGCRVLMDL